MTQFYTNLFSIKFLIISSQCVVSSLNTIAMLISVFDLWILIDKCHLCVPGLLPQCISFQNVLSAEWGYILLWILYLYLFVIHNMRDFFLKQHLLHDIGSLLRSPTVLHLSKGDQVRDMILIKCDIYGKWKHVLIVNFHDT
jgi:hypothetical protein